MMGTEPQRMIFHPIVPILLLALLFTFKKDETTRNVAITAISLIGVWIFAKLQNVFMPFVIGFSLAYLVNLVLSELQKIEIPLPKGKKYQFSRRSAAITLLVLATGLLAFFVLVMVPQLLHQGIGMRQGIAQIYDNMTGTVKALSDMENGEGTFNERLPESWRPAVRDSIREVKLYVKERIPIIAEQASDAFVNILGYLSSGLIGAVSKVSNAFFILIVFVYSIQSLQKNMVKILSLFPEDKRQHITLYASAIDKEMRSYLRGLVLVIIIISFISIIVYSIIRVPFALLVGLLAGLSNAIPTVGPVIGGAIAVFAAFLGFAAGDRGTTGFLIQIALIVGATFAIQAIDNSLISPKIMSKSLNVHPLVVLFAVLLAASLLGIWGAFLAIPGIIVVKNLIKVSKEIHGKKI